MIIWNFISIVMSLVFETVYFPKWDLRLNVASSFGETTPFHLHVLGIFKKNQVLWLFLNGSLSPHPARSLRGFFSDTYCGNQVERLEENLIILWGSSWLGSPWVFDHIEPSAACQLQFTFSFLALAVSLCPVKLWPHVFTQLFLYPWGQWFAWCPPLSHGIKKNCWFFSLCSFPLENTVFNSYICSWVCPSPLILRGGLIFVTLVLAWYLACSSSCCLVTKFCPALATPWTVALQAPLSMEFPRQEYWFGLPFPSPRDLPDPAIEPASPALAGRFFTTEPPGKPKVITADGFFFCLTV